MPCAPGCGAPASNDALPRRAPDPKPDRLLYPALAQQVARQLMATDALGAHTRDELGISEAVGARPLQAAWASAAAFTVGAGLPLLSAWLAPAHSLVLIVGATPLLFLALLGGWRPTRAAPQSHAASCG